MTASVGKRKLYILLAGNAAPILPSPWLGAGRGLARFPNDTEILFEQACLLAAQGDLGGAETNLLMLLRIPGIGRTGQVAWIWGLRGYKAQHSLALVYRGQRRSAEAEAQWRAVLAERPGFVPAALGLGELILAQQRGQELGDILHRLDSLPNGAEAAARLRTLAQQQASRPASAGLQTYSREFYIKQHLSAYRSAKEVVPHVVELLRPKCIIDVGCGVGSWLAVFREHGITDVLGVDSACLDLDLLQIPREQFLTRDLAQPLKLSRQFDLALSLEVAEHLPAECAAIFVASLVSLAPVVLFSAAVPYQGGTHHINEQYRLATGPTSSSSTAIWRWIVCATRCGSTILWTGGTAKTCCCFACRRCWSAISRCAAGWRARRLQGSHAYIQSCSCRSLGSIRTCCANSR